MTEVLCLDADIRSFKQMLQSLQQTNDGLVESQKDVVDRLLGDKIPVPVQQTEQMTPLHMKRPNWNKIKQEYEIKKKNEYWQQRIAEVEARDREAADKAKQDVSS